ncbi:MAG: sigma-70 family RNA polymerase sigma factor [Ginsengibacter sp.]
MSSLDFDQLLIGSKDYLKPFAFKLTSDTETAKDLLQETVYRALANKEKYNFGTNIKAWLYTIMRNIFINDYRKKGRQPMVSDSAANEFHLNQQQLHINNAAEVNLKMREINTVIHDLPAMFKHPFMLYFEGYRYHEIAVMLSEPLGTIKSRIHFARKLLKEQINRFD